MLKLKSVRASVGEKVAAKTFCVVCPSWEIKIPSRCSNTIKKAKKTLYFCTKRCKERYLKSPEKFQAE